MAGSLSINEILILKGSYASYANIEIFVETGTNYGNTILGLYQYFKDLYTVEIKKEIYDAAVKRIKNFGIQNIHFYLGDSAVILVNILKIINEPAIFFLDGHYSHGDTGRGNSDTPLLDELKIINNNHNKNSVIIIDDYNMFGTNRNEDWTDITIDNIIKCFSENKIYHQYVNNDRLIILLKEI